MIAFYIGGSTLFFVKIKTTEHILFKAEPQATVATGQVARFFAVGSVLSTVNKAAHPVEGITGESCVSLTSIIQKHGVGFSSSLMHATHGVFRTT